MDAMLPSPMLTASDDAPDVDLATAAAALAITEVQADIRELAARSGRAGLVAALRRHAADLAPSGVAFHQVKRVALQAAADDIAWGRAPLRDWRDFFAVERPPAALARAEVRLRLGPAPAGDLALEDAVATEIERQVIAQAGEAFLAARDRWALLELALGLQAGLWDDPRLSASDEVRLRMRAGERGLRRLLGRRPTPTALAEVTMRPLWRRLLAGLGAAGRSAP